MVEYFPCSHISVKSNHYILIRVELVTAINIEKKKETTKSKAIKQNWLDITTKRSERKKKISRKNRLQYVLNTEIITIWIDHAYFMHPYKAKAKARDSVTTHACLSYMKKMDATKKENLYKHKHKICVMLVSCTYIHLYLCHASIDRTGYWVPSSSIAK